MTSKTLPGITVNIARAEIERHLANLDSGNSLTPSVPERGWTGNDMLALAGICLAGAMSQGPEPWGGGPTDVRERHVRCRSGVLQARLYRGR
jgi:hypothetical protein